MKLRTCFFLMVLLVMPAKLIIAQTHFQPLPSSEQSLDNLNGFLPVSSNWTIVGDVSADRFTQHHLLTSAGKGVLANLPTAEARGNLFSDWEHGDLDLELDFMMPKGSNAGVYLQGRYEIQLLDSWNVERPTFADAGGIYQRWDGSRQEGKQGYEGHPPLVNASRAPGLWQHLRIEFQAPRFDKNGMKTSNAIMKKVIHNGVVIHQNVEVTGPTRAAAYQDEKPSGPLMIQGDHGPVAVRDITYKRYQTSAVTLSDVRYQVSQGVFEAVPDMNALAPYKTGETEQIDWRINDLSDQFAAQFSGTMYVPFTGTYRFHLQMDWLMDDVPSEQPPAGAGSLVIGGRSIFERLIAEHGGKKSPISSDVQLTAGTHPFTLTYFKNSTRSPARVSVFVEGSGAVGAGGGLALQSLNAEGSLPTPRFVPAIYVVPGAEPALIRGFVEHGGKKKTHVIAVGDPEGIHYTMDLRQGALLHSWKGPFIETTDMWHSRGQNQLAVPRGAVLSFTGTPSVAHLDSQNSSWPDSMGADYTFKGYELDADGRPTFMYDLGDVSVSDQLVPDQIVPGEDGQNLSRKITLQSDSSLVGYWVRVASGKKIVSESGGVFRIDGNRYYIEIPGQADRPLVRTTSGGQELLVPFSSDSGPATVHYTLIW